MRWNTIKLGVKNLMLHKLRSMLTVLGVILGVASVVAMLAIGEGSKREALDRIRQLGANNVIVRSVKPQPENDDGGNSAAMVQTSRILEYGLTEKDYDRMLATLPTVTQSLPVMLLRKDAQRNHRRMANARVLGTTPLFLRVKSLDVQRGRCLTDVDMRRAANVVVLAAGSAKRLFNYEDPIGQPLLLGADVYRVVGVLAPQSGSVTPGGVGQADYDDDLYIPLTAARSRFGEMQMIQRAGNTEFERVELSVITLTVANTEHVSQAAAMVRKLLRQTHPDVTDVDVRVPLELLRQAEQEKRIWNLVLGSIAGISLLVGGIGIMNIMLANVTERTREIGIRRALGAKQIDITVQFLVETVVLSSTGGVLGILIGVTITLLVTYRASLDTVSSLWSIVLAFGISTLIGVVFGLYPARRAAMMDPIEALRHE